MMALRARSNVGLLISLAALMVASLWLIGRFDLGYVAGDPLIYYERMQAAFTGFLPYYHSEFEHLPLMLMPMAATWLVGGFHGPLVFRAIWVLLTSLAVLCGALILKRIDRHSSGFTGRWLLGSVPLVPLVLFRTEPWLMLPVSLALVQFLRNQPISSGWSTVIGVLGKGWPLILSLWAWKKRWYRWIIVVGALSTIAVGLVGSLPGFVSGRTFSGLHSESLGGALWAFAGISFGYDVFLVGAAGAIYVDAPLLMSIPGVVGLGVVVGRLWVSRALASEHMPLVLAAIMAATLAALPLQSTQFLFWISPFVAFSRKHLTQAIYFCIGAAGLAGIIQFDALYALSPWWFALVIIRNIGLIWLGTRLASEAGEAWRESNTRSPSL